MQKCKLIVTPDAEYPFNVQVWTSVDGGRNYFYAGYGKFCKSIEEADEYISGVFSHE